MSRFLTFLIFVLTVFGAAPALGQLSASEEEAQERLEDVLNEITLSEERAEELGREIEELSGNRAELNAELIAAAQRVKLAEIEVTDIEERLLTLRTREAEIQNRLDSADRDIGSVLTALQRISRNPPPALVVDPSDALGSARGAMLIAEILPQLNDRAEAIVADLRELETVKTATLEEEDRLRANLSLLQEDQLRIATLIEARRQGVERNTAEIAAQEAEADALAAEAENLNELIEQLEARLAAASLGAEAMAAIEAGQSAPNLDEETVRLALTNTDRTEPAVPFTAAKGFLAFPAAGVTVTEFGEDDGFGGTQSGMSVVTRAEAQIVSPADAYVLYRGPYLNYGQIVVLSAGQGYSILLAGLEAVTVDQGQFVMMGEPVGQMGSRTLGQAVTTSAGASNPTLYIELRDDNQPIDPSEWWASETDTTRNG